MRKNYGFTLTEALMSVAVLAIIGSISIFSLTSSQRTDQLNTAVRVVAADLRSLQASALTSENIMTCLNAGGANISCVTSSADCVAACMPQPPAGVGVHFTLGQPTYDFFAEVEPSTQDWILSHPGELYQTRALAGSGAPNVVVSALSTGSPTDVAFERQNGSMVINGCQVTQGCATSTALTVTLRQTQSGALRTVTMNAFTGRISIQ